MIESTLVRHVHDEEADRNVQRPEYMYMFGYARAAHNKRAPQLA